MGVPIVTSAHESLEVLYHPELVAMREQYGTQRRAKNYPRQDSELEGDGAKKLPSKLGVQ